MTKMPSNGLLNTPITASEIKILQHTIGLDHKHGVRRYEPYRNHYNIYPNCDGFGTIVSLCERGFMEQSVDNFYSVTAAGQHFLSEIMGITIYNRPKYDDFPKLPKKKREDWTGDEDKIYCPHCGSLAHGDFYESIFCEFDLEALVMDEDYSYECGHACKDCGKAYHISVQLMKEWLFTTMCEKA